MKRGNYGCDSTGIGMVYVVDLKEGFNHIKIEEEDKNMTTFEFDGTSVVMGFKNSQQILQRIMNRILGPKGKKSWTVQDDIVIHGKFEEKHYDLYSKVYRVWRVMQWGCIPRRYNLSKRQWQKEWCYVVSSTLRNWEGF